MKPVKAGGAKGLAYIRILLKRNNYQTGVEVIKMEQKNIRELAKKHEKLQTLMHFVNYETLKNEHEKQSEKKAVGVDGIAKMEYSKDLNNNLNKLLIRMKKFQYKPKPVRRVEIPKPGSDKKRPLGIPSYEDKLVQGCMANVLNSIYETKFLNMSYGFRPNKNCHQAISKVNNIIQHEKINFVLDADIKGFFDNLNHEWLMKFLANDIQDKNFLFYIERFLKSGIMKELKFEETDKGTPQGGLVSPVLANVYLHYVLDLWFKVEIKPKLKGKAYIIRYADDFVILCQYEEEAYQIYEVLKKRLNKFNLEVAEDKTRIIPFGKIIGNTKTFDFLGFTFMNGKTRNGKYMVQLKISKKKKKAKKKNIKQFIKENMHMDMAKLIDKINKRIVGLYAYYGVNGMYSELANIYNYTRYRLFKTLNRRGQKKMNIEKYNLILERIPIKRPKIYVQIWA